jgi:hypothetical protein
MGLSGIKPVSGTLSCLPHTFAKVLNFGKGAAPDFL